MSIECPRCHSENPETKQFCADCGTQLTAPKETHPEATETLQTPIHELTTGSTFAGRYQVIEELGKGGMGRVYRVLDKKLNEEVVLKLIKPEIGLDKKTIERFSNELKLSRKTIHKNVARMFDLNEEKGTHYITMEYVQGEDLRRLIRKMGTLSPGQVMPIAKQVCEGLMEAHRLGVVHRDLKPSNIMIDEEGNARIMDFGIARSVKERGITGEGVIIGTPEYMSPEQVEGKDIDQRSDIYSLGVILFEMMIGHVPFEGNTALSIAVKHKTETPKNPRALNAQVSEELSRLILRCLEKDKEKRYQSAEDLRTELSGIEKGIPAAKRVVPKRKPFTSKEITATFGLKKLLPPILGLAFLIIAAIAIWKIFPEKEAALAPSAKKSIAVLPFVNMSTGKEDEYFSDGMTEELINALSKLQGLSVAARTSCFAFKGKTENISNIGQQLHVDNVLEGSFRKAGNKLRIAAQLIEVASGFQLWSETYEREIQDVFAVQDEISQAIVSALKIKLTGDQSAQLTRRYTENPEGYQFYMKGRYYWNKRTEEGVKKGLEYFNKAIELDPDYALAYAGLADSWLAMGWYRWSLPEVAYARAKTAAEKALEIDNTLAEVHTSLAHVRELFDLDWSGAEAEYKQALELNPLYPTVHHWYSLFLMALVRPNEAVLEAKRAQELDPLSLIINENLGDVLRIARRYDEAIEQLRKTLEIDPNFRVARSTLVAAYTDNGMYDQAVEELQKIVPPEIALVIKDVYHKSGIRGVWEKQLELAIERSRQTYVSSYGIALFCARLGKKEEAFALLEKAFADHSIIFTGFRAEPGFESLRSDPRYTALLKKAGLE